jgi:ATP-binding cassette subfamily C protein CydD
LPFPAPERLDLGRAFFVLALAPEVYVPWRRLAAAYHDRQAAEAAVDALAALEAAPRPKIKAQPAPTVEPPPGVTLERVCVTYPDNDRPSLKDFDLRIGPGEIVALMGPSGSGKTTILNLVLGLLEPDSGAVLIDGTSPGAGSRPMAWAGQWPVVAPGTLGENLAMAKPKATRQELLTILRLVGLDGAGGLDRPINERGGGLSGGERRRLGLGRAFLKASSILLLDEPTANLDPASEQIMIPIIAAAAAGRTTLIATHSPAVAALADRVIHLEA